MDKIKNIKDARKFAKKVLDKTYKSSDIHTITHAVGTNVWTVHASSNEFEIILSLNSETGKLFVDPEVRRVIKVNITESPIPVTDSINTIVYRERKITKWRYLFTTIGLTVVGSVISAFFDKGVGITISLIFGGLSIWFGRDAFIITKETERA
ncbi:MAG: hypothetical protein KGH95_07695 [Thaumarchaeota archaeon]|nr:hypothetical protein [Nitrososphaerota archaeon]